MPAAGVERHPSDGWLVLPFETKQAFEDWLDANHRERPGLWVKFAKKGRGIPSVTLPQATEVALCFGWIDSKMYRYDDDYYVLRYQPRRPRSNWSASNKELAERLIANGRMRPAGLAEVEAAKSDGRWNG
ncbi:MAG: YdeI/OmpD-associated family protein [Actinomycetes bacterium]